MSIAPGSQVDSYLKKLPAGIASYPECRVTAVLLNKIVKDHPDILARCQHPGVTAAQLAAGDDAQFLPLTVHVAAVLALVDKHHGSAAKAKQQLRAYGIKILATARYKVMFFVLSPMFIVMGVGSRYGRDFLGVKAKSESLSKTSARLTLSCPANLYPEAYVTAYNGIFEAAIECAGGRDVKSVVERAEETQSITQFSWS